MHIENKNNCTGCGACFNICPNSAITMQSDEYGFYKPIIDKEKCVDCNLCENVCPLYKYKSQNFNVPKVYAFMNSDEEREKASSGGAFSAFAQYVLSQNGIVYGVVWNDELQAEHFRAATLADVEKMHGSKYVQGNTKRAFSQAKEDLENGRLVLFSGTPCQIAGLKSCLKKEYDNLITLDIVCHGVQAPLFLNKYKSEFLKNKNDEKILNINFRSKKNGWQMGSFTTKIVTNKDEYYLKRDIYTDFMDLTLNECCSDCRFTGMPRVADVTVGDFWGVDKYDKSLNDGKGLSIVLINSQKASDVFEKLHFFKQEVPLEFVVKYNPNILSATKVDANREKILKDLLAGKSLEYCGRKYIPKPPIYVRIYDSLPQWAKDFIKYKIFRKTNDTND